MQIEATLRAKPMDFKHLTEEMAVNSYKKMSDEMEVKQYHFKEQIKKLYFRGNAVISGRMYTKQIQVFKNSKG